MTNIQVDEKNTKRLERAAIMAGITIEAYVKILVQGHTPKMGNTE